MGEAAATSETVICTYRVRAGCEEEFVSLLRDHWPALDRLGLVTGEPSRAYRGTEGEGKPTYVEIFTWMPGAAERAYKTPEIVAIWDRMEPLVEERGGRPKWEFPHYVPHRWLD